MNTTHLHQTFRALKGFVVKPSFKHQTVSQSFLDFTVTVLFRRLPSPWTTRAASCVVHDTATGGLPIAIGPS